MSHSLENTPERSISTLADFSSEVQHLVDSKDGVEDKFDELCRFYPNLAEQYLEALAADNDDANPI